ncbi:MaoC family dehydratase N-terminal domain-containing protein [Rhodococcus qingshengii]|uniref:MaoC family dehydratase n=1 Tax=Rhodococcus qingshengii TaxID=334542 RepID=UPI001E57ACE7|nr:MaoC/PaaZ C-terminal domain-containing protein [Rhodococcus qingshengii]MCD2135926.1 MaoC family dehydratase N-terminal domain-containing protein [Rhodococcus qingshengii]
MISNSFDKIVVGATETSIERVITEEYVRDFAELTWDRHPLHLDPEYAAQSRFGGQIAHGALMISTLLGLVDLDPRFLQCFYELDQVKFHAPTYFGDTVHAVSEVLEVRPRSNRATGVVICLGSLINQNGTTVLSGHFSFLVGGDQQGNISVGASK